MKMLMIQYRDEQGLPRAYAVGPIDMRDKIEELAKGMLDGYRRGKIGVVPFPQEFERIELVYEQKPEGHVMM